MSSEPTYQQLEKRVEELEERISTIEQQQDGDSDRSEIDDSLDFRDEFDLDSVVVDADERRTLRVSVKETIKYYESTYGEDTPIDFVHTALRDDYDGKAVLETIDQLRREGEIYEPVSDCVRTV